MDKKDDIIDIMKGATIDFMNCSADENGNILSISLTLNNLYTVEILPAAWNWIEGIPEDNAWIEVDIN